MPTRPSHKAFTLVELLIVIVILGILAILLFPTFKAGVQKARQTELAGNMKTIAGGMMLYANDNGRRLPATYQPGGSWQDVVSVYLGRTSANIFHDPLDTQRHLVNGTRRLSRNIAHNGFSSGANFPPPPNGAGYRLLDSIAQPSKLLMLTTGESQGDSAAGYCIRINSNTCRSLFDLSKLTRIPGKHMCTFVDGHTELIPAADIMKEAEKDRFSVRSSVFFDGIANNGQP